MQKKKIYIYIYALQQVLLRGTREWRYMSLSPHKYKIKTLSYHIFWFSLFKNPFETLVITLERYVCVSTYSRI